MDEKIQDKILGIYDELLDSFDHVKKLNIDCEKYKQSIKSLTPYTMLDDTLEKAHNSFVSEVILSALPKDMAEAKKYITYPDFYVKTYIDNLYCLYNNAFAIEKSLVIAKLDELNFIINDERFKRDKDKRKINVISFMRLSLSPDVIVVRVTFNVINTTLFYEYYSKHLNYFKSSNIRPNQDDLTHLKSLAIHDAIIKMQEWDEDISESYFINSYDYLDFKKKVKRAFNLEIKDKYISGNGKLVDNWLDSGIIKLDNRPLIIVGNKEEIIPLRYQKSIKNRRD